MKKKSDKSKRIEISAEEAQDLLKRIESGQLADGDLELIRGMIDTLLLLSNSVDEKAHTIKKLLRMFFGSQSEKSRDILDDDHDNVHEEDISKDEEADDDNQDHDGSSGTKESKDKKAKPGHGRLSADDYTGAEKICVSCEELKPGDICPECKRGKVYLKEPRTVVRITSSTPFAGNVYELERLRCNACGSTFTAEAPEDAKKDKYDEKTIAMTGLLHYGTGLPFNRMEKLQASVGIPVNSSKQWELVEDGAKLLAPIMEALLDKAAQGKLLHNDDTTAKILEFMGRRLSGCPPDKNRPHRKGMNTTGIIADCELWRIAVYSTGLQHAGENLQALLRRREPDLPPPIQMCDGLEHNIPTELETILSNCLAHSRRKFVEIRDNFPEECRYVIRKLGKVYHNDATAKATGMDDEERLRYHQKYSSGLMRELKEWMEEKFPNKETEPNSALGYAIRYALKRWKRLTAFLRIAGAPLDNNICERALKKSILCRKNSLFYKTPWGARVGDLYMSIIHTCELNKVNPFEYLVTIMENASAVAKSPNYWMPWNYRKAVALLA